MLAACCISFRQSLIAWLSGSSNGIAFVTYDLLPTVLWHTLFFFCLKLIRLELSVGVNLA